MTAGCHDAIRNARQPDSFDAGMCLGIIKGLHYLSRDVCIPPATSLGEIADIVSRYVDSQKGKSQMTSAKRRWKQCDLLGPAVKDTPFNR